MPSRQVIANGISEINPAIPPDEAIPMAVALELLPAILEFNNLEPTGESGGEVAELDKDFPRAAPDG